MIDNETNLTLLNVNQIVSLLSRAYIKLIKNGTPLKSFPSVMLWGPPGIGKSQGVREIAGNIQAKTGKMVFITDVRLLLFNPVDLRGIPTANADKTLSVWLKAHHLRCTPGGERKRHHLAAGRRHHQRGSEAHAFPGQARKHQPVCGAGLFLHPPGTIQARCDHGAAVGGILPEVL